jgi:hypothetical protein
MTLKKLAYIIRNRRNTIAIFGNAQLIRDVGGRVTLEGGTTDDRRAALEWCSLFLHEALITP